MPEMFNRSRGPHVDLQPTSLSSSLPEKQNIWMPRGCIFSPNPHGSSHNPRRIFRTFTHCRLSARRVHDQHVEAPPLVQTSADIGQPNRSPIRASESLPTMIYDGRVSLVNGSTGAASSQSYPIRASGRILHLAFSDCETRVELASSAAKDRMKVYNVAQFVEMTCSF
jgi:hypothetical protein